MKLILNIVALAIVCILIFSCFASNSYMQYQAEINKNIQRIVLAHKQADGNKTVFSSQSFRDNLGAKLYGKENYDDMTDNDMASRIYGSRLDKPTRAEIKKQRAQNASAKRKKSNLK